MTFRDLIGVSLGNLWRMKLRSFLTISGVVIAIAAFVAMLSFGAGNQRYIEDQFEELGLFNTMQVFPKSEADSTATSPKAILDKAAVERISTIPGVRLAYPYRPFTVRVRLGDSVITTKAQALPSTALQTKIFSRIVAGQLYADDSAHVAVVSDDLLTSWGISMPDSAIDTTIIISISTSSLDSGLVHILKDNDETIIDRLKKISLDSLRHGDYRSRIIREELNASVRRFLNGFLNAREEIADTLIICGVLKADHVGRIRIEQVILPTATAERFQRAGFSGDPADLFAAMSSGRLFASPDGSPAEEYPQVTLDLDPHVLYTSVRDSVKALGYDTFSFAEEFQQIQKFFFYFDLGLGLIGLIALSTASLGIINTMVMSILERKREIGVLKSLGAGDWDIRRLFLVESAVIGALGASLGILFGWLITRVVSAIAQMFMRREGIPEVDLFALPIWLVLIALAVGIGVSLAAGLYPSGRAARVDPVEALRNE